MSDLPLGGRVEPAETPEQTVARWMAAYWGKTFSEPVTEENFIAQATRIVREVRSQIVQQGMAELRQMMLDAQHADLIPTLYWEAGAAKIAGLPIEEPLGKAADLLARVWVRVDDGTLDPPNWVKVRQDNWIERYT